MPFHKKWEDLRISDNFLFLKVMSNAKLCRHFLEKLLRLDIRELKVAQTEKTVDNSPQARGIRLDVYVEDGSGTVYDIEMQAEVPMDDSLDLRMRYYQSMIDLATVNKGWSVSRLRHVFIIFVCAADPFNLGLRRYTFRSRCDENRELTLRDRAVKLVLNARGSIGEEDEDIRRFLDYVAGQEARGEFAGAVAAEAERVKRHDEYRREYMTVAMLMRSEFEKGEAKGWKDGREAGWKDGEARGLQLGEENERRRMALNLLGLGVEKDKILAATGYSPAQLENLLLEKASAKTLQQPQA